MDYLTKQSNDFSKWYNEVVLKAELADYSPVRGCMVVRPYGWELWERMKDGLDKMIKDAGVKNARFPLFIPMSFFEKEKEHVEGFSPELAVVTHGGGKELTEPLAVRPTSETIIYRKYADWIHSYRDLPLKLNQWCNVVRWEKRTYLFLRTMEFFWQEGHTAHATHKEAEEEMTRALKMYEDFYQDYLAIDPFTGDKSEQERFAGALRTLSIEALVKDGKFIQAATSHDLGQNFAKPFEVQFQSQQGQLEYVWQTSWGLSTRALGTLIMSHGDDKGLILPPKVAPVQVVIVPIWKDDQEGLRNFISQITKQLDKENIRYEVDWSDQSPGWKFNQWELKGVPLRMEVGQNEVKDNLVTVVNRLTGEKQQWALDKLGNKTKQTLLEFHNQLLEDYREFKKDNTHQVTSWEKFKQIIAKQAGAVEAHWCGSTECEDKIKEETKATTRVLSSQSEGKCIFCNKQTKQRWIFGKTY